MTSRFKQGGDIKEISSDISYPFFFLPFRFSLSGGKAAVLRGPRAFYVKLEEIFGNEEFRLHRVETRFFFFFPCEMNIARGFLDVEGVMGKMWDMRGEEECWR